MIDGNGGQWEEKDLEQKPDGQGRILLLLSGRAGYFSDSFNDMMKFPGQIGIGCAVEHFLPVPSGGNQTCGFEQAQMMGNGRAGHLHIRGNIRHALLSMAEKPENPKPGRVSELL